jgi:hypothetical protein
MNRAKREGKMGIIFSFESMDMLDGKLERIELFPESWCPRDATLVQPQIALRSGWIPSIHTLSADSGVQRVSRRNRRISAVSAP